MKTKTINNILIKALIVICSPILVLCFGILGVSIVLFSNRDYDDF